MFVLKKENTYTFNMPNFQILKSLSVDLLIFKKDQMKKMKAIGLTDMTQTPPPFPKHTKIPGNWRNEKEITGGQKQRGNWKAIASMQDDSEETQKIINSEY